MLTFSETVVVKGAHSRRSAAKSLRQRGRSAPLPPRHWDGCWDSRKTPTPATTELDRPEPGRVIKERSNRSLLWEPEPLPPCSRIPIWLAALWKLWSVVEHDVAVAHILVHQPRQRLRDVHVIAVAHLVLLAVATLLALSWLKHVILPALLAGGMAVLLGPVVFCLVDPWVRCCTPWSHRPSVTGHLGDDESCNVTIDFVVDTATAFRRTWSIFAAFLTLLLVLGLFVVLVCWVWGSVGAVDWNKYFGGERFERLNEMLRERGIDDVGQAIQEAVISAVRASGVDLISTAWSLLVQTLLMFLFLLFFLIDIALARSSSKEPWRFEAQRLIRQVLQHVQGLEGEGEAESTLVHLDVDAARRQVSLAQNMRTQLQQFIKTKLYASCVRAVAVGSVYSMLKVDLWAVWSVLTVILSFVPYGSVVVSVLPLPFIALDPDQGYVNFAICIVWVVIVHQVMGNLVEPRLFAHTLSLDPVAVLMALTFWTTIWGVVGALVCVPLTAMLRVVLVAASRHPYAPPLLALLEGITDIEQLQGRT